MRIVLLILIAVIISGCRLEKASEQRKETLPEKSLDQYKREFQVSLQRGDTVEGMKVIERYLKRDSADLDARAAFIALQIYTNKIPREEGMRKLQTLFDRSSSPGIESIYLSVVFEDAATDDVVTGLDSLVVLYPARALFHTRHAYALMDLKRYDEAIRSFTNASRIDSLNLYLKADRSLAVYLQGDEARACNEWRTPGGGSQSYYEKYCKWPEFEKAWNAFIQTPNSQTIGDVETILRGHYDEGPDQELGTFVLTSWTKMARRAPGNEELMVLGFALLGMFKEEQHYLLRCELAKFIPALPKPFLEQVRRYRHKFEDLNEIVGAFEKSLMNDKTTQLRETEKRMMAINSVNDTPLIKVRGECMLALEKKRERLKQR